MKRCNADEHVYDESRYSECPYCRTPPNVGQKKGKTKRVPPAPEISESKPQTSSKTRAVFGFGAKNKTQKPVETHLEEPTLPVVGWLVITKGKGMGKDFKLVPDINKIGRDESMDVCLNHGDNTVSRNHAALNFNWKKNEFMIFHTEGRSLIEINGEDTPMSKLKPYDRILIGETELLFIPLCGEQFKWED